MSKPLSRRDFIQTGALALGALAGGGNAPFFVEVASFLKTSPEWSGGPVH